jgi:hypothetical protein
MSIADPQFNSPHIPRLSGIPFGGFAMRSPGRDRRWAHDYQKRYPSITRRCATAPADADYRGELA